MQVKDSFSITAFNGFTGNFSRRFCRNFLTKVSSETSFQYECGLSRVFTFQLLLYYNES